MKKETKIKQNKGITLIALVVTIIVLLILSAVSITVLFGKNGLIDVARNARIEAAKGVARDKITTAMGAWAVKQATEDPTEGAFLSFLNTEFGEDNVEAVEEGNYNVTVDGYTFKVEENGNIINTALEVVEPTNPNDWITEETEDGKGLIITGYKGNETEIVIPNYINGVPVLELGSGIGSPYDRGGQCETLWSLEITEGTSSLNYSSTRLQNTITKVTISKGITTINKFCFSNSVALTDVVFPTTLTSIDDWAFSGCTCLEKLSFPNGLLSIGSHTFSSCIGLTEVRIPCSVASVGQSNFSSIIAPSAIFCDFPDLPIGWHPHWCWNCNVVWLQAFGGLET